MGQDDLAVDVVLDTNVIVDMYSSHDVYNAYAEMHSGDVEDQKLRYRRARARESLLLGVYLHRQRLTSFSYWEPVTIIEQNVDKTQLTQFNTHFTTCFLHFVKDHLLHGWNFATPPEPDEYAGNEADAKLIEYAGQHGLPLITNEGFGKAGVTDKKMRKKAKENNVDVFTPYQFWNTKLDEHEACSTFLEEFNRLAPGYVEQNSKPETTKDSLLTIEGFYRHILLGETKNPSRRVTVSI